MRFLVSRPVEHNYAIKSRRAICSCKVRALSYFVRTVVFFFFFKWKQFNPPKYQLPLGEIQDLFTLIEIAMSFPWYPFPPQFNDSPPYRPVPLHWNLDLVLLLGAWVLWLTPAASAASTSRLYLKLA